MTEQEFLFIHDNPGGNINSPNTININFDEDENDSTIGILSGMTVTVSDVFNEDLDNLLLQVESIKIKLTYANENSGPSEINTTSGITSEFITVDIATRQRRNGANYPYYYFTFPTETPTTITPISSVGLDFIFRPGNHQPSLDAVSNPNISSVSFTPSILTGNFSNSPFNPLISNASLNRESSDRQISDRDQATANPSNIVKLLQGTAELASIPDSNYSDTGLVNARYEGSKNTNTSGLGSIDTAINGTTFRGIRFVHDRLSTSPSEIAIDYEPVLSGSVKADAVINDYFSTGPSALPRYALATSSITFTTSPGFNNFVEYGTTNSLSVSESLDLSTGMFMQVSNAANFGVKELVRVNRILNKDQQTVSQGASLGTLELERNYDNTLSTPLSLSTSTLIKMVEFHRILEYQETGTDIFPINSSNVYINDNGVVITTDEFGTIYTGSAPTSVYN